jgi:hypothetical protein
MNNEIAQNEKTIHDLTLEILSHDKRFKEKGIAFRVELTTTQDDPHESKFIKDAEEFTKWFIETLNRTYQDLIQYD